MRFCLIVFLLVSFIAVSSIPAQSPNGTINGIVLDPTHAAIAGADVTVVNDATRVQYFATTNNEGIYFVSNLPPGSYRIQVAKIGFKTVIKPDITLNVLDALAINFALPIGALSEIVTVSGGAPLVNTTDASVSTVVDHNFVENMPLNGRSFQDLILLTPGVVTNSPQSPSFIGTGGEFSVNGQRTESNYYTVDGVSANVAVRAGFPSAVSNSGSLPSSTVLGTTQSLASLESLEEFRVQSSTYSAEYGRNPGGQFSFATRSGTNDWHGAAFEYFRNDIFDANDWFNNYRRQPKPSLRQNDFGGTLGGPLNVPHVYQGRDKTFFFFSYEGLRLVQPQASSVSYVPGAALRQAPTASALLPVMNAFPIANGQDLGNGLAEFIGAWSQPSAIDSYSIRLDHALNRIVKLFFRFSDTGSSALSRSGGNFSDPAVKFNTHNAATTYTGGANLALNTRVSDEFRLNYSSSESRQSLGPDAFGGSTIADLQQLQGVGKASSVAFGLFFSGYFPFVSQGTSFGQQRQWNIADTATISRGLHQLKLGIDYRRLAPRQLPVNPAVEYDFFSANSVQSNNADSGFAESQAAAYPVYTNFSAFGQDQLRVTARLTLSMGLRWELNPAPGATRGNLPYTIQGDVNNPGASLSLAPSGTPLWKTYWYSFAPRIGVAYVLRDKPGFETVLRAGGGVFFDTGQQLGSQGYQGPGFTDTVIFSGASFPLSVPQVTPPISNPPVAPYTQVFAYAPHLQLPYTWQWNGTIEQGLGKSQALTLSYVGANGRRLLRQTQILPPANPNFGFIGFIQNGLTSDYDALQIQYQHNLSSGLQALGSYTWSHAIDYGSNNASLPYVRGNADFDVRHSVSAAVSYQVPNGLKGRFGRALLHHWAVDDRWMARTGFPVTLNGRTKFDPVTGKAYSAGLDLVSGESLYIYGSQFPGDRSINPAAFALPAPGKPGDAPRNLVRGFGAWQMDLALRRDFPLTERTKLQFRAEAFNVFNHPDFGTINAFYCPPGPFCTFGKATSTLAHSLGVLGPLYQMGGPRSMQFALRVAF